MKGVLLYILFFYLFPSLVWGQDNAKKSDVTGQRVYGRVSDESGGYGLSGVTVRFLFDSEKNTITDSTGNFSLSNIPLGRQSFQFSSIGYETKTVTGVLVIAGKQMELKITLTVSYPELQEVTIKSKSRRNYLVNEFATVSSKSFNVEETRRYAATIEDPARMALNFPGVSFAGDASNSIIVRANSPQGILWKLEGIEIPNPNHFASLGSSGGAVSMLNANTMAKSDFYAGGFPPEIGNALSGAFDISLRNGNSEKKEHSIKAAALGLELSTEGPFTKRKKASYLIAYRYSTFDIIKRFVDLGADIPAYQDATIKINMPAGKLGNFSFFALTGYSNSKRLVQPDSSLWKNRFSNRIFKTTSLLYVAGLTHQLFFGKDSYLKTTISNSKDKMTDEVDTLNINNNYQRVRVENTYFDNTAWRLSMTYNKRLNHANIFRAGIISHLLNYNFNYSYYDYSTGDWKNMLDGKGNTTFIQAYSQWKIRTSRNFTFVGGLHSSFLTLNKTFSLEPRVSLIYKYGKSNINIAAGLHSKPGHLATYTFQNANQGQMITYPNKNLRLQKAVHVVLGYSTYINDKWFVKTELYYQYLYHIPVESDSSKSFSVLNLQNVFGLFESAKPLVSIGKGNNYGIDVSIERPLADNYYLLATASLFQSLYTDYSSRQYSTRFNRNFQINITGGRELLLKNGNPNKTLGVNGRLLYSGGLRESKIDLAKSIAAGRLEIVPGEYFTQQTPAYFRADISFYLRMNGKKSTHTIQIDIQNLSNRRNYAATYFDSEAGAVQHTNQLGRILNFSYRFEFHK